MIKEIAGGAVVAADILWGMALPSALQTLHHEAHPHWYGVIVLSAALGLLTLWLITSLLKRSQDAQPAAPQRPVSPFGGRR